MIYVNLLDPLIWDSESSWQDLLCIILAKADALVLSYCWRKRIPCSVLMLSHVQLFCDPHGLQPTRLLCPWNFPGKNNGVGCHLLLQGTLPPPRIEFLSLASPALGGGIFVLLHHLGSPWELGECVKEMSL